MKIFKQFVLVLALVVFASGMSFAQRGPRDSSGSGNGNPNRGKPDSGRSDVHRIHGLKDSCWMIFLQNIPADSARMLVNAQKDLQDIKAKMDTLKQDLRRARQAKDTAAVRRIMAAISDLAKQGREDIKTINTILRQYRDLLIRILKECDDTPPPHRKGTTDGGDVQPMIVTPIIPNPATSNASFTYTTLLAGNVQITISDLAGLVVKEISNGPVDAGKHEVRFDVTGMQPNVYLVRVQAGAEVNTQKLMVGR